MKRYLFAAAAALCSLTPLLAQEGGFAAEREGTLAPTVPVVPAPMLHNGSVLTPEGGSGAWGASSPRFFSPSRWSAARSPVATVSADATGLPPGYNYAPPPPLPTGMLHPDVSCGSAMGCSTCGQGYGHGHSGRARSCWEQIKAWWCYAPSKTELPMCRPVAYTTPLLGMFPCVSNGGYGCGTNCGSPCTGCGTGFGNVPYQAQPPVTLPPMSQPKPMTSPMPPSGAGPVMMRSRGTQGIAIPPVVVSTSARLPQK